MRRYWKPPPVLVGRLSADEMHLVGYGGHRDVYGIDGAPGVLAKILQSDHMHEPHLTVREFRTIRNVELPAAPLPLIFGMIDTDHGPAQIVEAILDEHGDLAPTLQSLVETQGLTQNMLAALNDFVGDFYRQHIPATDFSAINVVFGEGHSKRGRRFYLIDGFGERRSIPIKEFFASSNVKSLDKHFKKIARPAGLSWNVNERRFSEKLS